MSSLRSRSVLQRRLAWLLWFGLLFPVAQASAAWHALSHTPAQVGRATDEKQAPHHPAHCDLCLIGAAIGGGAANAELPIWTAPAVDHALPQAPAVAVWLALPAQAYRSRAPPLASR